MKANLAHLDAYRLRHGSHGSPIGATFGWFEVPNPFDASTTLVCCACDGEETGWDHVSVRVLVSKDPPMNRVPHWREMDWVKDSFFEPREVVAQFHVSDGRKVNHHSCVLHLWKPTAAPLALPPRTLV